MPKPKQKIDPIAVRGRDEAVQAIAAIGSYRRALAALEAALNDEIARLTQRAEKEAEPLRCHLEARLAGLEAWCAEHRAELTKGGKTKTADLGTGTVSWRFRPPSVKIRGKVQDIIARCLASRSMVFKSFVRTKYELNKEAMLARPEEAERLEGVKIVSAGEDFIVEPFEAEIVEVREP